MKSVVRNQRQGEVKDGRISAVTSGLPTEEIASTVALIQALIPWAAHRRRGVGGPGVVRWGQQPGSVYLADQKLPIPVPRVGDRVANREIPLTTYERAANPAGGGCRLVQESAGGPDLSAVCRLCGGGAGRLWAECSSVSRRFIRASARHLRTLDERRLDQDAFVAVVLDGKTFAQGARVSALGLTLPGQKKVLGFVQTATENEPVCVKPGLLCIIDGATGLRTAIRTVFGAQVLIQRGQWHKRENVVRYLPKTQQAAWRRRLQQAYEGPTYAEARAALGRLRQELRRIKGHRHLPQLRGALQAKIGKAERVGGARIA